VEEVRVARKKPQKYSGLLVAQITLLCVVAFISPLVAGKMTPIPAISMQLLTLAAAVIWLIRAAKEGVICLPPRGVTIAAGVFYLLLLASAVDTASLNATLSELGNIGCYLLIFLMVASLGGNRPAVYGVLASLVVSASVVGALGLKEYILTNSPEWRVFATFFNPDFLAGFMVLMLPITLAWYASRVSSGAMLVAGISVLLVVAGEVMSGSRLGALSVIGGIFVFLLVALLAQRIKKTEALKLAAIVIPVAVILLTFSSPLTNRVASMKAESHSSGFRIYTWKGTARMAAAHPINGTGLGTFELTYPKYATVGYTKLAHNSYLQTAAEAGPIAAVALLVLLGISAIPPAIALVRRRGIAEEHAEPSWIPDSGLLMSGLLGGAAASMARNLVDSDWYVTAIGLAFWIVLGAIVGLGNGRSVSFGRKSGIVSLAVTALAILVLIPMLAAEIYFERGTAAWSESPEDTLRLYQTGIMLNPLSAEHHRRMAQAYLAYAGGTGDDSYFERAKSEMLTAIRLEPYTAKNYYQLGRLYEFRHRNDQAVRAFEASIERHPNAPELLMALARSYEVAGREKDALATWRKMVKVENSPYEKVRAIPEMVEPEYIFAHKALGEEFECKGDKAGAVKEYKLALVRINRYLESVRQLSGVLDASGFRDEKMELSVEEAKYDLAGRVEALKVTGAPAH
jgi:O-antigen ligase/tetratricopeptide (TPR) repeat protein